MYAITTGNMTQLRILDLRNNQLTGWGGVPAFSDLPYLTTLHLSYNNLGERGSGLPL
jgi:Leucine-rich repeat (LRR) protein